MQYSHSQQSVGSSQLHQTLGAHGVALDLCTAFVGDLCIAFAGLTCLTISVCFGLVCSRVHYKLVSFANLQILRYLGQRHICGSFCIQLLGRRGPEILQCEFMFVMGWLLALLIESVVST